MLLLDGRTGYLIAVALITLAAIYGDGWQLAAAIVFGTSLLLLYAASTLYHSARQPHIKARLKVLDHCGEEIAAPDDEVVLTAAEAKGRLAR